MRAILPLVLVLQISALAEEPVKIAWSAAVGDAWSLRVVSERKTEVQTGKEPVSTEFKVTATGELRVVKTCDDGSRECEFTFATLEGTVQALGITMPITDKPGEVEGKKVKATLSVTGQLAWDNEALRQVTAGFDLGDDLARLFPALPKDPVVVGGKWNEVFDRHTDAYELKATSGVDGKRVASFSGDSKADESIGGATLTSTLKVEGQFSGEWDMETGSLKSFEVVRKEVATLVSKESTLATKTDVKRRVVLARKEK